MFRATSPPFIGSVDPPLSPSVMAGQATQSVRTGAFDARALPAQCARIDAQARVVPNPVKNSPAAISATGETAIQATVFHSPLPRRVTSLPNRVSDAMDMARDAPPTGIGLLNELSLEEPLIAGTGLFLIRMQGAVESRVQSLLFSGGVLGGMVFRRVAGSAVPETAVFAAEIAIVEEAFLQVSTTCPAAVDVAPTFERAPGSFY